MLASKEMRRVIRNEMELFFGSSVHRRGGFPYLPVCAGCIHALFINRGVWWRRDGDYDEWSAVCA